MITGQSKGALQGKVALITGGAAGIGLAIAKCYLQNGAQVVLLDRAAQVVQIAQQLDEQQALGIVMDVTDKASVEQAVAQANAHFGRLDVLVNSAGIVALYPAEELPEDAWDSTMAVNLKGVFLTSQAVGHYFIRQGSGSIINLASQAGVVALPNHLAYCASKAGVIGLTQVLALEWGPHNVRVNAISPTVVLTELGRKAWSGEVAEQMKQKIPLRRFAEPEDIAASALFLASDAASMITGSNLVVDGGYTIQ
ncbi:TPA: SDR family oxidoreductase [Serratia fonticola]|jgi:NAD(P)-dependent dehydrogenase (short-subunit alcohol dehydrogenase family)|uniref:SDR family oxidoreductase n=1 Tax=Serratia fonticola TaxID=47917 RepID=UPI00042968FE|nr:D-threitol dehydrogenase [Serratia fonticola]AKG67658.1 short-chain dehydrogenase [Serratia fonticola]MBL5829131.1 D-threitol dehydrogenase [Serratia fonticola]CAI0865511.1 2-(S)-hydroxypropyl-CoM dehydrogenase [Serratia fonticola]CAI0923901.1 2-(S)-hydroxypropyl-CoM dehydrogenase [Serratia fonticola]CAI1815569.1 2-(S)-hydroxypropyl-CoM dehydrogenase [Serratia fonticola]